MYFFHYKIVINPDSSTKEKNKKYLEELKKSKYFQFLRKMKPRLISNKIIQLFYEKPQIFFNNHKTYLKNKTYFDNCGFSIFAHYFYVLFNERFINKEIYEKNFSLFFTEYKDDLMIQDYYFDTPLHKLAKLNNKNYFLQIFEKLNSIKALQQKILEMKNMDDLTCIDYIKENICNNFLILIKKNENINYKFFINYYINNCNGNKNEKILLQSFEDGFYYNYINFKEIKFQNFYEAILNIINNKKEYIYNIILFFAKNGINYLNFLFHLCENWDEFDKLFILIKKYLIQKRFLEKYIYKHASYVLRKMNSYNKKGNEEIKYGINLIKFILEEKIKYKNNDEIFSILLKRKIVIKKTKETKRIFKEGLIYNIIYNPNISFEQKSEIFFLFKKLNNLILKEIEKEEFIQFYNFFEFIEHNEITKKNVLNKYNSNESFKYIISLFNKYKFIYQIIFLICKEEENKKYIDELNKKANEIISKKIPYFFKYYLSNSEKRLYKILNIVSLYSEQDSDSNPIKINDYYRNKLLEDFFSNENFTLCFIKYIIKYSFPNDYYFFFEIIFNSEFDLTNFINEYKTEIKNNLDKIKDFNNDRIILTEKINLKNIYEIIPLLEEYPLEYELSSKKNEMYLYQLKKKSSIKYYYVFLFFADYFKDLNFLSQKKNFIIFDVNSMIKKNLEIFLKNWNEPYNFDKFISFVENDILVFCKLLIIDNSLKEENCLKINFFFELIYTLNPNLQKKFSPYQEMVLNYISKMNNSEYFGFVDESTINNFYLMLILMYIKYKYGNYNPEILFLFLEFYQEYNKVFIMFIKCIKENKENNNIVNHFFMGDYNTNKKNMNYFNTKIKTNINQITKVKSLYFLLDNIIFFFNYYLNDLIEIKFSLVYDYIISVLTIYGKYNKEKECLIPSIMLNIGQNEKIINIILEKIINWETNLYDFLKVEYDEINNENKFRKYIYYFIQLPKKINLKSKYIFPSEDNNFHIFRNAYYFPKKDFVKNAKQFFSSLKKKSINLYDCLYKNIVFIKQTFDLFFFLLYEYDLLYGKNNSDNEALSFIGEEIYEFILKFINSKHKNKNIILNILWTRDNRNVFIKIFHERIIRIKDKEKINYEFGKLIELLDNYVSKEKKGEMYINFGKDLKDILKHAIENDAENCCKYFDYVINIYEIKKERLYSLCHFIILTVIINNIKKYKKYLEYFLSLIKDTFVFDNNYQLQKNNFIINYHLKDTEFNNMTNVFHKVLLNSIHPDNIYLKLYIKRLINEISDEKMSSYLLIQIRKANIFKIEEDFLLFILDEGINNKFFFDYLFNFLVSERKKNFFELNKIRIIKSLFIYGQNNDYYFLKKLLEFISNYMTKKEIREIIYPLKDIEEDIKQSVNYLEENIDNFFKSREKYLFVYCLNKKRKHNYETIALLFDYCPKTFAIFELCPFLNDINSKNNLDEFSKEMFHYLNFFKKEKNLIKKISNDFYNFSSFLEIFVNTYYSLKNFEKNIFLYYIQIFILEIVPKELLFFFKQIDNNDLTKEFPDYEQYFLDEIIKLKKPKFITEQNIFIILSLYEMKRIPLIPIKKYFPEFFNGILGWLKKFKKINIPILCLKRPFDINCLDKINDLINNKTEKLLDKLYKHNPFFNLIFIIEKEKNLLFNLNTNNYLAKILYNLLSDNNINLQPENIDDNKFINALRCELGTGTHHVINIFNNTRHNTEENSFFEDAYIDTSNFPDNIIKNCIFTLKNFDHYTSILLENCWNSSIAINYDCLGIFRNFLRILFTICNYILTLSNKSSNDKENIPNINIFNSSFFAPFNDKLKSISNSISIDQISKNILKYLQKIEETNFSYSNNYISNYFCVVENWLTLFKESPFIQEISLEIQKEDFNYITFFKYLKINCLTLINFLNIIEEIDFIKFSCINDKNLKIENVDFIYEPNKSKAKKLLENSMYNLGQEIVDNYKDNNYCEYKTKIDIGYYYNNDINNFVETYSGIVLYDFFINKIMILLKFIDITRYQYSLVKKDFDDIDKKNKEKKDKNKKNKNKDKNLDKIEKEYLYKHFTLFDKILSNHKREQKLADINRFLMPYKCNYADINKIMKKFDLSKYNNLLCNYLQKTSNEILEPDSRYYPYKIYKYFYTIYFTYMHPVYNFNLLLSKFCYNEDNILFMFKSNKYNNYKDFIDFFGLIEAIFDTEFNKDKNLNNYFQKELLYFLINSDNSLLYIFLQEIYNLIRKETIYRDDKDIIIKDKFKIEVKKGFKYSTQYISKIKQDLNMNINNKKFEIKEDNKIELNKEEPKIEENVTSTNNNIDNNNIIINTNNNNNTTQKKKKFKLKLNTKKVEINSHISNPNLTSENKINNSDNNNSNVIVVKNYFKRKLIPIIGYSGFVPSFNYIVGKSKINHMKNIFNNEIIFINKNEYKEPINSEKKENKKLNIFNLIFRVGGIQKDKIILNQYDISDILDKNMDKITLEKIVQENLFITSPIPKYWDKILNLAFIYGQLRSKLNKKYNGQFK